MGASCALRGQGEQLPGLHPSTRQGHLLPPMTVTATMSGCWRVSLGGNISLVVNHCSREMRTTPRGSGKIRPSDHNGDCLESPFLVGACLPPCVFTLEPRGGSGHLAGPAFLAENGHKEDQANKAASLITLVICLRCFALGRQHVKPHTVG